MKMFIGFVLGVLMFAGVMWGYTFSIISQADAAPVVQEAGPDESRFEYVESGKFPSGTALDKQEYQIFRDKITGVKYIYFYRFRYAKVEGSDRYDHRPEARTGGPSFTKLEEPALDR